MDLARLKTAILCFNASKLTLPRNIQRLFSLRNTGYALRGYSLFILPVVKTTKRSWCVSVCGVKLWNKLDNDLKQCTTIYTFKLRFKQMVWTQYTEEEM